MLNPTEDCSAVPLESLEYPRHLHKGLADCLRVDSVAEALVAVANGWRVDLLWPAPVPAAPVAAVASMPKKPAKK